MIRYNASFIGIKAEEIIEYFTNPPQLKNLIKEVKILEKFPDGSFIRYWRLKFPLISDRDNIMLIKKKYLANGGIFIDLRTIDHPQDPKYPGVIRMFHFLQGEY